MIAPHRYSILIVWSDEDHAYLVTLPEWEQQYGSPVTHGETYEDALANALVVLAMYVAIASERGENLPALGAASPAMSVA